jgi:P27 family predicted phage terminase small subunit
MGMRPKPTRLKILAGKPGHHPLNLREPQPAILTELPQPPMPLSRVARQEWIRTGGLLLRARVLTEADLSALAAYCVVYGRWVEAENDVRRRGVMVPAKPRSKNLVQNPFLGIANKALQQMVRLLAEFGLTPSTRTRIVAGEAWQDVEEMRKAERYLGPQPLRPTPGR